MSKNNSSEYQFTFAVIADTHINEGEEQCNSPFNVNKLANARLRHVVEDLNRRELEFVIHLGDVVHPVPSMGEAYDAAMNLFKQQCTNLKHPIHVIPGNHDVGDKPIRWGPAGVVRQSFLDSWDEHFDQHYFSFEKNKLLFIGLNVQVLGSGLPLEQQQHEWLERLLSTKHTKRVHLFMHYPPFLNSREEPEHYDNLGVESRRWIISLIEKHQIEALYAGHVHHFWFNKIEDCHCYLLPSTCFTRQDYTEMFRVQPTQEFGRDDAAKLGYFLVHVFSDTHRIEMVRSNGQTKALSTSTSESLEPRDNIENNIPSTPAIAFDLRHDWCEQVQIPPSGGLDEFDRKWVRNDYALLALSEMGIQQLRVPLADLREAIRLRRLHQLASLGFSFTLYSFEFPSESDLELISSNAKLISNWEIAVKDINEFDLDSTIDKYPSLDAIKLIYSPLRSKSEILATGKAYFHVINHGFFSGEPDLIDKIETVIQTQPRFGGISFRNSLEDDIWTTAKECREIEDRFGISTSIQLRVTGDNPATPAIDDSSFCCRLIESLTACWAYRLNEPFCDALTENDRGYFPRNGVLDRLYNPKPVFSSIQHLQHLFARLGTPDKSTLINKKNGSFVREIKCQFGSLRVQANTHHSLTKCDDAVDWIRFEEVLPSTLLISYKIGF